MRIRIEIIDAFVEENIGKVIEGDENERFFFPCSFAQYYGQSGMPTLPIIKDMVKSKESARRVKINCCGYGDHNHTYSCDNYIVVNITICDTP